MGIDWSAVIVGGLSLIGTALGSWGGMKLMSYRIEQLERKVNEHNGFAHRLPVVEQKLDDLDRRVEVLEHGH